jgi:hypothetical protein
MNYQQTYDPAQINGEEIIPTVCGMRGPGGDCRIYAFVKNGRFNNVAGTCPCVALTLISTSSSEKLLHEEQSIRLLSMQVSS